ncbi:bifunctional proline dehydrogenase/L-glutamate gamma-semialdehyde dehydrogenase PutA [Camelimonas sp. ID_303_24]
MQPRAASIAPDEFLEPFSCFAPPVQPASALRQAITAASLTPERQCLPPLLAAARCADEAAVRARARQLTETLRAGGADGVRAVLQEYSLASDEGLALMRLAEALLRIPDAASRDAMLRDTIAGGHWQEHLGLDRPLLVNAATWGLLVAGRLVGGGPDGEAQASLEQLLARGSAPVIRAGMDFAMRLLGEQFVSGSTIEAALAHGAVRERRGYRHSYDMLGEAAVTAEDASRYARDYEHAIGAVGAAARGAGCKRGPGVSVKLSALHPRYSRAQAARVMAELTPRLKALALLARRHDISLTIDAEEADRLELSLDLFERLRLDPDLGGWAGLGFVVQAYGKRCPHVIDWLVDLARRSGEQIMVRLVKGAYWDTEIKRAQLAGLPSFPVFTRKVYTDASWLAGARRLLDADGAIYPQFATHNARSVAAVLDMTANRDRDSFEFQCLHGMGEPLHDQLLAGGVASRIYAPVGPHGALLAYLARRLLENGANSSFVRLAADPEAPVEALIADPVATVEAMPDPGAPHPGIRAPADLFAPMRRSSMGMDFASETDLAALWRGLNASLARTWRSAPSTMAEMAARQTERAIVNPGDHRDRIGVSRDLAPENAGAVVAAARIWPGASGVERAACLERAADLLEASASTLAGLLMREAGKTAANALGEVREAVDFLRYYGAQARNLPPDAPPLGVMLCISPWNFSLAIFVGQIAAALAAGNGVIAKPAEETPLIAAEAVRILHEAGAPRATLQLAPGDGAVGAALAAEPGVAGVLFTGSTAVARKLNLQLAERVGPAGEAPLLIAETGGLNCMIVDSSALTEQVTADVLISAFDSAGQRCSALRVLCLQEEIADHTLNMLRGAMAELAIGRSDRLAVDVGPVITAEAREALEAHVSRLAAAGKRVHRLPLPDGTRHGTFVAPTLVEIDSLDDAPEEAFGPILHVLRWRRPGLDALVDAINDRGFGLTFGLHTRLDATIARVTSRIRAGNVYVNRNMIGAVVGSQPFGGRGLSGTGPKAGGPLTVGALLAAPAPSATCGVCTGAAEAFAAWLDDGGQAPAAAMARAMAWRARPPGREALPGPAGEDNSLRIGPAGTVLLAPVTTMGLYGMVAATLAAGNQAVIIRGDLPKLELPPDVAAHLTWRADPNSLPAIDAALLEGAPSRLKDLRRHLAMREGPIVPVLSATPEAVAARPDLWALDRLLAETALSINIAAAGGNPGLLALDANGGPG